MNSAAGDLLVVCASHSPGMARDVEHVQGREFRAALQRVRGVVERFSPEVAIVFGPDHRRLLRSIVPAFTVAFSARGLGDMGTSTDRYPIPLEVSSDLATHLLERGVDVAVAREVEIDHGIGQTLADLVGEISSVPVVPIVINCATAPLAPLRRVQDVGRLVGEFASALGQRVLIVGSGGLSHAPPSLAADMVDASEDQRAAANRDGREAAAEWIDPEWDRRILRAFGENDHAWLGSLADEAIDPAGWGAHEVRAWVAAHAAGGVPLHGTYEPVPEWITGMAVASSASTGARS